MSNLREKFDDYCHDENTRACENCQYDDGNSDLIGCAMNFAYQKGREDAIDERASLLAYICKKYNIPLLDMNCTVDEWEELKEKNK